MADLKNAFDFYYGAVLSNLINKKLKIVLIENEGDSRRVYNCFTDTAGSFRILVKCCMEKETKGDNYSSWQFNFTFKELLEFRSCVDEKQSISVILILRRDKLEKSEYAVLHTEDLGKLLEFEKESVTISRKKGESYYRMHLGGSRKDAHRIPRNRSY